MAHGNSMKFKFQYPQAHWDTATLTGWWLVQGCFCDSRRAEKPSRDCMARKA